MNDRQKTAQVLADASQVLRTVAAERNFFMQKYAEAVELNNAVQLRLEAEKLAAEAHEGGYYAQMSFPDLVDYFEKKAQEGQLPVVKEAMQAQPPSMGGQFEISNDESQASGVSELERYLVGNVG